METDEIKKILDQNDQNILVINVLPKSDYEKEHIPGSTNIPVDDLTFVAQVEQKTSNKDTKIIVYCAHPQCPASAQALKKLEDAGFRNVIRYSGGVEGWKIANFDIESGNEKK